MAARYEYKVVPAPRTPAKVRGIRSDEARFALTIEAAINAAAAEGWEYLRSETLPCETRGWFSRSRGEQTILIFQRGRGEVVTEVPSIAPVRVPPEPRLAADRGVPRHPGLASLRAARDGEPG